MSSTRDKQLQHAFWRAKIGALSKTSKTWQLQNATECHRMPQNAAECRRMPQYATHGVFGLFAWDVCHLSQTKPGHGAGGHKALQRAVARLHPSYLHLVAKPTTFETANLPPLPFVSDEVGNKKKRSPTQAKPCQSGTCKDYIALQNEKCINMASACDSSTSRCIL